MAGQVCGYSNRYSGATYLGPTAWLYDGTTTLNIGLTDAEHTRSDGYRQSGPSALNAAGQVRGVSIRYSGGTILGRTAWLYDGMTTLNIGLTDAEHTRSTDGYRYSETYDLNAAGQVCGYSNRYSGGTDLGQTAWLYDGATTLNIGLTDTEHTRNDGYRLSSPRVLNAAGQVCGFAKRYSGATDLGWTAWLYDGTTTLSIGLTDAMHTRNDGYREFGGPLQLNEGGQVCGSSYRYNSGAALLGETAWVYDPGLDQTFPFVLSERSDGYAFSRVGYLGDDGLVLGWYELYDAADVLLGNRAFYFTIADGLSDFGALVGGGLSAAGWTYLGDALRGNAARQIIGWGGRSDMIGAMAYLLTLDQPPVADANGPYQFSAAQLTVALDGSGSSDDIGIASYSWDVDSGTTTLSGVLPTLHVQNSGLANTGDVVDVVLTVTDTGDQTDTDTTTISYLNAAPIINALAAFVDATSVQFTGEVQDDDLIVNQWISDFQVVNWELDLAEALTEGEVGDGFHTASVGGAYSDTTFPIDVTVPLADLPPGWITVWLNVTGSMACEPVTFFNHVGVAPIPEPATLTLLALGGLGLLRRRRRR